MEELVKALVTAQKASHEASKTLEKLAEKAEAGDYDDMRRYEETSVDLREELSELLEWVLAAAEESGVIPSLNGDGSDK